MVWKLTLLCLILSLAVVSAGCRGSNFSPNSPSSTSTVRPTPNFNTSTEIDGESAFEHVQALAGEIGPRPAGKPSELEAAEYIGEQLSSYGYEVELQEFPFDERIEDTSLAVSVPQSLAFMARALDNSGQNQVSGEVVSAGIGRPEDFPAGGLQGRIALIQRGELTFSDKVSNALNAGASAVIVYNHQPSFFQGALSTLVNIPVVGISREDGLELQRLVDAGRTVVTVSVSIETVASSSQNVIGRPTDGDCEVVVGGHYDSVEIAPGGNDNASGTAAVLEMARATAARGQMDGACFLAFGAEEIGLLGSLHFVSSLSQEQRQELRGMINLDVVGAGNGWSLIGSQDLVELANEDADELGIDAAAGNLPSGINSDHASFINANIPAVFITILDSPPIHTPQDTADIIQPELLSEAAQMGMYVLESLMAQG